MKYAWIDSHRELAPLSVICEALEVSRSGYHDWLRRAPSQRDCDDRHYLSQIGESFEEAQGCYGTRKLKVDLAEEGLFPSRRRIGRLMRSAGLECKTKKKLRPQTTDSNHESPIAENLLERCFGETETDRVYVGDITYIDTAQGWLYLAVWIDLCSRAVVGWSMQDNMRSGLVCDALLMALGARRCTSNLIVHSDRGSQYAGDDFRMVLGSHDFKASMSARGQCWDNAVAESFFHTLKTERVYHQKYATREQAKQDIFEYIEVFYNRKRRHSNNDYLSPLKYEEKLKKAALSVQQIVRKSVDTSVCKPGIIGVPTNAKNTHSQVTSTGRATIKKDRHHSG